jgi:hypothetical protein
MMDAGRAARAGSSSRVEPAEPQLSSSFIVQVSAGGGHSMALTVRGDVLWCVALHVLRCRCVAACAFATPLVQLSATQAVRDCSSSLTVCRCCCAVLVLIAPVCHARLCL